MRTRSRPLIIPIFIPHAGCPHQCLFCDQRAIIRSPDRPLYPALPSDAEVADRISEFLIYRRAHHAPVQVSFYGGNFLGLPEKTVRRLLAAVLPFIAAGRVDSVRCSTRPDTVTSERLGWAEGVPLRTVELGVQSMDDRVLRLSRRGHTRADTERAMAALKAAGLETGIQLMVGLPGDTPENALESARRTAALAPALVRIYPTLVLADSPLAKLYRDGGYSPLSLDAAVDLVAAMYGIFAARSIPVIRMGLQASVKLTDPDTVLAGPYHPAFGHLVHSRRFLNRAIDLLRRRPPSASVTFRVHSRDVSRLRGLKNRNVEILKNMFHISSIYVVPDSTLEAGSLEIQTP